MTLKTYRAPSMAQALAEVKKDLGAAAVILHTRTFRVGGIAGFGAKNIVEITASTDRRLPVRRVGAKPRSAIGASAGGGGFEPATYGRGGRGGGHPPEARGTVLRGEVELKPSPVNEPVARDPRIDRLAVRAPLAPVDEGATLSLQSEIASIKRLMGQVLQKSAGSGAGGGLPDVLFDQYMRLMDHQVSAELADAICGEVRSELSPAELSDAAVVHQTVLRRIESRIKVDEDATSFERAEDGRPRTIALIGPTGVGKTTTLAKLAAIAKLRHNKKVGLITCDTYRIAAVEQLRTYANIIALPIKVAMTAGEVASACESLLDCDVVLVDTPGRSQHDTERLDELHQLVEAARPHERDLVLSSVAAEPVLERTLERFSPLEPTRVILTKLDEAVHLGPMLNMLERLSLPASFVTIGQEVPDHIEPASAARLARLILDGPANAPLESAMA